MTPYDTTSCHTKSHHITPHHTRSHHIILHTKLHHITAYHTRSHHIIPLHVYTKLQHITAHHMRSQHIILLHVTPNHITNTTTHEIKPYNTASCHIKSQHTTPHAITPYNTTSCYTKPPHITPHHTRSQHMILLHIKSHHSTTSCLTKPQRLPLSIVFVYVVFPGSDGGWWHGKYVQRTIPGIQRSTLVRWSHDGGNQLVNKFFSTSQAFKANAIIIGPRID